MEKTLIISEADRIAICEAADMLKKIYQGHAVGMHAEDVRDAYRALHMIRYEDVSEQGQAS